MHLKISAQTLSTKEKKTCSCPFSEAQRGTECTASPIRNLRSRTRFSGQLDIPTEQCPGKKPPPPPPRYPLNRRRGGHNSKSGCCSRKLSAPLPKIETQTFSPIL